MATSTGGYSHSLKKVNFLGRKVVICLQNENGPCPLLAICNALLLRGNIKIHPDIGRVSSDDLVAMVANRLIEANPLSPRASMRANQQHTIDELIKLLPSLQQGLDVNVRFTHPNDFEYNSGIALFEMLDMGLFHGWIIDPQDEETMLVVGSLSYNQVVEKVIAGGGMAATDESTGKIKSHSSNGSNGSNKSNRSSKSKRNSKSSSPKAEDVHAAKVCRKFLEADASQLTYYGLTQVHDRLKERQIGVLFRNNHFTTIFKIDGAIYSLVTDLGYQHQNTVMWECLNEINGNTDMVSPEFGSPNEYLLPEDLQGAAGKGSITAGGGGADADAALAQQLQNEENQQGQGGGRGRRGTGGRQSARASGNGHGNRGDNKSNCVVS